MANVENKWALLIGIDLYLHGNSRHNEGGHTIHYPSLGGCVNDIRLVRQFLRQVGVSDDHVLTLTAPNPAEHGVAAHPSGNRGVTRRMVLYAFNKITQEAQPGDLVYIHYSGHGGRARTVYEDLKGRDGYDETLVPSDIEVPGGQYIRDVEVAKWLEAMVAKKLTVTLIMDSCHSGSATRSEGGAASRGIGVTDNTVLPTDRQELVNIDGESTSACRGATGRQTWLLEPQGYAYIAACCILESAHEIQFSNGVTHGAFTYCLMEALRGDTGDATHELIHSQVCALVHSYFINQTPVIAGDSNRLFFGIGKGYYRTTYRVTGVDSARNCVTLDAGHLHGVRIGQEYDLHPFSDNSVSISTVRVQGVADITATATLIPTLGSDLSNVAIGYEASLSKNSPFVKALVRLVSPYSLVENTEQNLSLQRIRSFMDTDQSRYLPWRLSTPEDKSVSFLVHVNKSLQYEIRDSAGHQLPNIPAISVSDPESVVTLSRYIGHIIMYRRVERLIESPTFASLSPTRFDFMGAGDCTNESLATSEPCSALRVRVPKKRWGRYEVFNGQCIHLSFKNLGSAPVYLTVFNLKQDWGIEEIYPLGASPSEEVLPGQERELHFTMEIPSPYLNEGWTEIVDDLKAIITLQPTSLKSLELESIVPGSPALAAGARRGADLDDLLDDLRRPSRGVRCSTRQWQAHDIVIRTLVRRSSGEGDQREPPIKSMSPGFRSLSTEFADPGELLIEYIEWHKVQVPCWADRFDNALAALRRDYYDLDGVRELKTNDWEGMGVKKGIGARLSRMVPDFQEYLRTRPG